LWFNRHVYDTIGTNSDSSSSSSSCCGCCCSSIGGGSRSSSCCGAGTFSWLLLLLLLQALQDFKLHRSELCVKLLLLPGCICCQPLTARLSFAYELTREQTTKPLRK
jgi:hypothetical protein